MKVAIIGIKGLPSKGGAERVVEAIITRLALKGISFTIYCDAHYTPRDFCINGVRLIRVPTIQGKYFRTLTLVIFSTLHALLLGKYDLVHLHNIEVSFVLPVLRLKYKVLGTAHGFAYWRSKWGYVTKRVMRAMDYFFINFSNVVSSVSSRDAKELEKRFNREVLYIANGVGTEFHPDFTRAEKILKAHGIQKYNYFIFVAGRIEPTKGAHLAIEAVNRLGNEIPLLIVGDNNQVRGYREELYRIAGPKIIFQPLIEEPSILFGLMKLSICLLFPSLVEAMSMALLEAVSLGVPVVCSDIEENRSVLKGNGIYFKSGDVDSLIKSLIWVLEHRKEVRLIAENLRGHVHNNYSWEKIADQYYQVYRRIIYT